MFFFLKSVRHTYFITYGQKVWVSDRKTHLLTGKDIHREAPLLIRPNFVTPCIVLIKQKRLTSERVRNLKDLPMKFAFLEELQEKVPQNAQFIIEWELTICRALRNLKKIKFVTTLSVGSQATVYVI